MTRIVTSCPFCKKDFCLLYTVEENSTKGSYYLHRIKDILSIPKKFLRAIVGQKAICGFCEKTFKAELCTQVVSTIKTVEVVQDEVE